MESITTRIARALSLLILVLALAACGGGSGGGSTDTTPVDVENVTIAFADPCTSLIENPRTGLACLHCTQREARTQARILAEIMVSACIKNVATQYLVDGTFGYSQAFLAEQIATLTQGERNLFLIFFLANGAAQRNWDTTRIEEFGTKISPAEFRERIQNDKALRDEYRAIAARLRPVAEFAIERGATVGLIPQLEDNLSDAAFQAMLELTLDELGDLPVMMGRNKCFAPGYPRRREPCVEGSELTVPEGVFPEAHSVGPFALISGGVISNDGIEYESPALGSVDKAQTTLADIKNFKSVAHAAGNTFILWSGLRQGLVGNFQANPFPLPSERTYAIPSSEEREELVTFLRGG